MNIKYAIIGAGVIGTAVARELAKKFKDDVFVFERNKSIKDENQTTRNSGVVHSGIYYSKALRPQKAIFCVEGNAMLYDFCKKHDVPHENTGKLLVATNDVEAKYIDDVLVTARQNGVPGVRMIDSAEVEKMEPNVKSSQALYVPSSGIIDPFTLVQRLNHLASDDGKGANFVFGSKVLDITPSDGKFRITTEINGKTETFEADNLINCAGLYSDDIAKMVNPDSPYVINPTKGQAVKFYNTNPGLETGMNVYPAPHGFYLDTKAKANVSIEEYQKLLKQGKVKKTVGVHLTPTFDLEGGEQLKGTTITVGPLLTSPKDREDYAFDADMQIFYDRIKPFFPNLKFNHLSPHQTGILAMLMKQEGSELKPYFDFLIERDQQHPDCVNLIGIDSPGLAASLAIAKYVGSMFQERA